MGRERQDLAILLRHGREARLQTSRPFSIYCALLPPRKVTEWRFCTLQFRAVSLSRIAAHRECCVDLLLSGAAGAYGPSMPRRFDGPAMDLANMRSLGVRSIVAECDCGRRAAVDVSRLPDLVEVPALARRLRCSSCGSRPVNVRPDWREYRAHGAGR